MVLGRDRRAMLVAEPDDVSAWTIADVARALRRARTAQGLRVDEVGQGAGVAVKDLRALESAALDRFPDSLSALRAVRRSADYLGLPGDQLALVLMERWPLRAHRGVASSDPTSLVPAVGSRDPDPTVVGSGDGPPTEVNGGLRRPGLSREALFGAAAAASTGPGTREVVLGDALRAPSPGEDATQAVPVWRAGGGRARGGGRAVPHRRISEEDGTPADAPPAWLRVVVIVVVLAVLAGVVGIVVSNLHHGAGRNPAASSGGAPHNAPGKSASGKSASGKVGLTTAQTSSTSTTITVGASSFTVTVSAVSGAAWVQVTQPTSGAPVFSNMMYSGQSQTFTVHQSLTVETGSVAGHTAVTVATKQVGTYVPPAAPYYMTFKSAQA